MSGGRGWVAAAHVQEHGTTGSQTGHGLEHVLEELPNGASWMAYLKV